MIELPSPDSNTIWSVIIACVSAPVLYIWRKLAYLESNTVSKEDFQDRLDQLEKSHTSDTHAIRNDIARLDTSINLLITNLLGKK